MANERSLAVGVSFLGYGTPGDGVAATEFTQCPIVEEGTVVFTSMILHLSISVQKE